MADFPEFGFGGGLFPTPDRVTIGSGNDPALKNARIAFRSSNPGSHNSVAQAVDNLVNSPSAGNTTAVIIGHGVSGRLDMKANSDPNVSGQSLDSLYISGWQADIERLRGRFACLLLLGCNVGADGDGASLLFALSNAAQTTVTAPTGLVSVDDQGAIWYEDGTLWGIAAPNMVSAPPSIAAPVHPIIVPAAVTGVQPRLASTPFNVPLESVHTASIVAGKKGKRRKWTFTKPHIPELAQLVNLQAPFKLRGALLGKITGRVQLSWDSSEKPRAKELVIYNNVLLVDPDEQIAFRSDNRFSALMLALATGATVAK